MKKASNGDLIKTILAAEEICLALITLVIDRHTSWENQETTVILITLALSSQLPPRLSLSAGFTWIGLFISKKDSKERCIINVINNVISVTLSHC